MKHPDQAQLREKGGILAYSSRERERIHHDEKVTTGTGSPEVEFYPHAGSREHTQAVEWDLKVSKATPFDVLPPARLHPRTS